MKKIILGLVAIVIVIVVGLFVYKGGYLQSTPKSKTPIIFSMDVEVDNPIKTRVFWTKDQADKISNKQQVSQKVEAGKSTVEIVLPTDSVYKIRLDFGSNPGKITVYNLKITGANEVVLDVNKFRSFNKDVEKHEVIDDKLVITSTKKHPYGFYKDPLNVTSY